VTYKLIGNVIIDPRNNTVVEALSTQESGFYCSISPNSKYFYAAGDLYKISNNNLIKLGKESAFYFIFIEEGEKYIIFSNNTLQVKQSSNMSIISSMSVGSASTLCYDPATGYIGFAGRLDDEFYYFVYDINTWREIKRVHICDDFGYGIANSILFNYEGYYLPLNLD
jgi:hypothetical protein